MTTVSELGIAFPRAKDEAWKYTRAARFFETDWPIEPVRTVSGEGFAALNLALAPESPPRTAEGELELRTDGVAGKIVASRPSIRVDRKLVLVERFGGPGFVSASLDLELGPGAEVEHVRIVDGELHHGAIAIRVGEGARYRLTSVVLGGSTVRIEPSVRLATGSTAELFGLLALRGTEHADHHVTIDHAEPRATSRQTFRSLLDGRARGVFTGRVMVRRGAAGTDSAQVHRALLLSDDAVANARPQLEIDADDVKCAHGAAIGSLDPDALFYLRQRGLDPAQARALLTAAFAGEIVGSIPTGPVRDEIEARIDRWMTR